jgi:Ran GTPase-activating protein (RanGAP) involved in mRNA processing and transport
MVLQLDLSNNRLCGVEYKPDEGTYTAEGITAIADALRINGALTTLNLSSNLIGGHWVRSKQQMVSTPEGPKAIADALLVNGALTKLSLAHNKLEEVGTKAICEALEQNKTLKELDISGDWAGSNIGETAGVKHVAKMLGVNGGLTKISLAKNGLGEEGTKAICEALEQNTTLKELDLSGHHVSNIGETAGAKHVAKMLGVNGGLTALDLSFNDLKDDGVSTVCEAIQSNKETKLSSLNFRGNGIGPVGANAVAAMVAVTGGLTVANLMCNQLDAESIKMLAEVAKQKGISLCGLHPAGPADHR